MTPHEARRKIGMEIRSTNPHPFYIGKLGGEILDVRLVETGMTIDGKPITSWCYSIIWPDGLTDLWPIEARYEFRGEPLTFTQDPELEPEPELELVLPIEPAPRHQWRLEHASSKHGLEMARNVRVVCRCGWESRYGKDVLEVMPLFKEHESQEKDILF